MISVLISLFIGLMFIVTTLIGYIFILLLYVGLLIIWMAYISLVTELIALIILLVYVGAMAVLFIYVSAVSPNNVLAYSTNNLILLFFFLFILVSLLVLSPSLYSQCTGPSNLNIIVEIFSGWGIYLSFFVVSTLIIILAAVTFMSPSSSTFRCSN